ncbi:MAG: hypothetical protein IKX70_02180 [Treponema sp.]|nr:hypothetical protein [Treponema sp.]
MGSRGSYLKSGGFTEYKYRTLIRYNKVRYVVQTDGKPVKIPERSNSPRSVYVTLSKRGDIQSITFYRTDRRLYKEIDFLHKHEGMGVHVHEIDPYATSFRTGNARPPTRKEQLKIDSIVRFYKKHKVKELANGK